MSSQKKTHEWLLKTKLVQSLSTGTQTECPTTNSAKTKHYDRAQRWQGPKEIGTPSPQCNCPPRAPLQQTLWQDVSSVHSTRDINVMGEHEQSRKEIQMTNKYLGKMSITRIKSQLKLDVSLSTFFLAESSKLKIKSHLVSLREQQSRPSSTSR